MAFLGQQTETLEVAETVIDYALNLASRGVAMNVGVLTRACRSRLITGGRWLNIESIASHVIDSAGEVADVAQQYRIPTIAGTDQAKPPLQDREQIFVGRKNSTLFLNGNPRKIRTSDIAPQQPIGLDYSGCARWRLSIGIVGSRRRDQL